MKKSSLNNLEYLDISQEVNALQVPNTPFLSYLLGAGKVEAAKSTEIKWREYGMNNDDSSAQLEGGEYADAESDRTWFNNYTEIFRKSTSVSGTLDAINVDGVGNEWALDYIKEAGYTPMLYGYKGYLTSAYDLSRIAKKYQLWMAEYPDYEVTPYPNYNYFPSFENIGIFQFTSTYVAGGLDGNVDLTGITDNGYTKNNQPETNTPAIEEGKEVEKTPTSAVKVGDTVKVKFNVDAWATGEAIPDWVKGNSYKVQEVTGSRVLLEGILSWISKGDIELLPDAATVPDKQPEATHVVQYGETLSSIAYQYGTNYQTLAALNGLTNPNLIYPGQILKVNGSVVSNIYTVQYGDNLSSIAAKLGTTYQTLAALNGLANPNLIYPGQTLSH
ncbi:LysM peptidoglycan-binding domain-containing protein [Enterococcus faecalis]